MGSLFPGRLARLGRPVVLPEQTCDAPKPQAPGPSSWLPWPPRRKRPRRRSKRSKRAEPGDSREIASVCLLLRHFIHVTGNFCHLFCPFSQVVPWSSPAAPDFLSLLSYSHLSPLCSALFSLCSPLSCPLFSLSSCPGGSPRLFPVFCLIVCSLSFPQRAEAKCAAPTTDTSRRGIL